VATTTDRYHHGDLPNALRRAAVGVIEERGLSGFSLREVARRAGVSHNAPAHHFGDVRGLLTSLAAEGFQTLHQALVEAAAGHDDPVERLTAIGEAYVQMGRSHPAHCDVMFRGDLLDHDDPELDAAGRAAYAMLEDAVRTVIESEGLAADLDEAAWLCWSAMHGLVMLEPNIARINAQNDGRSETATRHLSRRFTALIMDGLRGT
jgi:AcrR family transcriptional regulator